MKYGTHSIESEMILAVVTKDREYVYELLRMLAYSELTTLEDSVYYLYSMIRSERNRRKATPEVLELPDEEL